MSRKNECKELPPVDLLREVFDYNPETGVLTWSHRRPASHFQSIARYKQYMSSTAGKEAGCKHVKKSGKRFYMQVHVANANTENRILMVHRICAALLGLPVTKDVLVDHKDGDIWNHKADNLRVATHSQSSMNCKPHADRKSLLPKGVWKNNRGGGYSARLCLGSYPTPELAYEAVCRAARLFHGEFSSYERNKS